MYREIDLTEIKTAAVKNEIKLLKQAEKKAKNAAQKDALKKEIEKDENKLARLKEKGAELIKFLSNGATPYLYTNAFKQDLMLGVRRNQAKSESDNPEEAERASFTLMDIGTKLAYIMNRQAENAPLSKLSEGDFFKWLEQFSADLFINDDLQGEIFGVYFDDVEESSSSKNS